MSSTSVSEMVMFGVPGWRLGLILIGVLSMLFAMSISLLMEDLSSSTAKAGEDIVSERQTRQQILAVAVENLRDSLRCPSFWIIVVQCALYQLGGQALIYAAMW